MKSGYTRRDLLVAGAIGGGALALGLSPAKAQAAWPARPVTLICPWGAGGGTDATARIVAAVLEKELKQPFNVVNRTGGSGVVGHAAIATAAPDGYTLGIITVEISMMHWQGLTELKPDSYTPLALMNEDPPGIQVNAEQPLQDRQGTGRRHQGGAAGQAEGLRHRPGRHLASGAGRLADGHGPEARSRGLGAARTAPRPPCRIWPPAASTSSPARCRKRARSSRPARRAASPSWPPSAIPRSRTCRR